MTEASALPAAARVSGRELEGLRSSIWVERRSSYLSEMRDGLVLRQDGLQTREEILAAAAAR